MEIVEKILQRRWYYHGLIWLSVVIIVFISLLSESTSFSEKGVDMLTIVVPSFLLTYLLFAFRDYFFLRKWYFSFVIIAVIISVALGYFAAYFTALLYDNGVVVDVRQWIQNMVVVGFIVIISQMAKRGIVSQLELQKLQVEQLKMELDILKAQLNPHFLFNTINNICGVNQVDSEKSTEMLIHFAEVLRYHLEFSTAQHIPIQNEIQLIKAFIELEKMRLRNDCEVAFDYPTLDTEISIAPLLLLPFVENAFKHGTHTSSSSFVDIKLKYDQSQLYFSVENSRFNHKNIIQYKTGQKNVIKRLQLTYPNSHELEVEEKQLTYMIKLKVDL